MKMKGKMDPNIMSKLGINTTTNSIERKEVGNKDSIRSVSPHVSGK